MKINTSKLKNAESFYIKQSYIDANGKSTSRTIRKLGTLKELLVEHDPTRDDVMAWAKEQARIETDYEFITKRKMKEIQKLSKQPLEK